MATPGDFLSIYCSCSSRFCFRFPNSSMPPLSWSVLGAPAWSSHLPPALVVNLSIPSPVFFNPPTHISSEDSNTALSSLLLGRPALYCPWVHSALNPLLVRFQSCCPSLMYTDALSRVHLRQKPSREQSITLRCHSSLWHVPGLAPRCSSAGGVGVLRSARPLAALLCLWLLLWL